MGIIKKIRNGTIVVSYSTLVILVFIQVFARYVLNHSFTWVEEVTRFSFIWLIYLGGIITIERGINICFDLVLDSLSFGLWKIVYTLSNLVYFSFLLAILVLGIKVAMLNMVQLSPLLSIPVGVVYLALPVGALGMILAQISLYITQMRQRSEEQC